MKRTVPFEAADDPVVDTADNRRIFNTSDKTRGGAVAVSQIFVNSTRV